MKKIFRIAWLELSLLFYSPIAWLLLMIFTFQTSKSLVDMLKVLQREQFMGAKLHNVTWAVFVGSGEGSFMVVINSLYLYIPLLTMGLMSREISSGSIRLLQSSPVRNREIVLGKFFAMMGYGLVLMVVLAVLVITSGWAIQSMDVGTVLAGWLGLYLLLCAYSAIGLFLSSLTSYQVIAAVSTLATLALLNYIGKVGQKIDIVRDITYYLSLSGRVDTFMDGLINTRDLLYFILVIFLFLGLCVLKLRLARETMPKLARAGAYLGLVAIVLLMVYLSSRSWLTGYYDATATKTQTLTVNSVAVAKEIRMPLKITTYINMLDFYNGYFGYPDHWNEDRSRFEMFQRFMPEIEMRYVYYYDTAPSKVIYRRNPGLNDEQLARKIASTQNFDFSSILTPAKMRAVVDLGPESYKFVRQLEYGGRKAFLRIYNDNTVFPMEQEITDALRQLTAGPVTVGFLTGDHERSLTRKDGSSYLAATMERSYRYSLINEGFNIVAVSGRASIPDSFPILVVADPMVALDTMVAGELRRYIARGGDLLVAAEPERAALLEPVLRELGVAFASGRLAGKDPDFGPDQVFAGLAEGVGKLDGVSGDLIKGGGRVSMPGVTTIVQTDDRGFVMRPLLVSDSGAVTMATLTRKIGGKEQRILVSGDADFMDNDELGKAGVVNAELQRILFRWLSNGAYPVNVERPPTADNGVRVSKKQVKRLRLLLMILLPLLTGVGGGLVLARRRRK